MKTIDSHRGTIRLDLQDLEVDSLVVEELEVAAEMTEQGCAPNETCSCEASCFCTPETADHTNCFWTCVICWNEANPE